MKPETLDMTLTEGKMMLEAQHWVLELQAPERNVDPLSFTRKLGQSAYSRDAY